MKCVGRVVPKMPIVPPGNFNKIEVFIHHKVTTTDHGVCRCGSEAGLHPAGTRIDKVDKAKWCGREAHGHCIDTPIRRDNRHLLACIYV